MQEFFSEILLIPPIITIAVSDAKTIPIIILTVNVNFTPVILENIRADVLP